MPDEATILPAHAFNRLRYDFSYGRPDVTAFPRQAWLRSLRRVLNETPAEDLSYLDGRGSVVLREALASYLNRVRATEASPGQMVITNGFAQAQRRHEVLAGGEAEGDRRRIIALDFVRPDE